MFSQLTLLRQLRLKGATSFAVSLIVAHLPLLELLDTEYIATQHSSSAYADLHLLPTPLLSPRTEFPNLKSLTIRTFSVSSAISPFPQEDAAREEHLWSWILSLVPTRSLTAFTLNAFSTYGVLCIPRSFVEHMTEECHLEPPSKHDRLLEIGLEMWEVKGGWMAIEDLELLCTRARALKVVSCAVKIADIVRLHHLSRPFLAPCASYTLHRADPDIGLFPIGRHIRGYRTSKKHAYSPVACPMDTLFALSLPTSLRHAADVRKSSCSAIFVKWLALFIFSGFPNATFRTHRRTRGDEETRITCDAPWNWNTSLFSEYRVCSTSGMMVT